jgi:pentatricopeptide repeat protein
MKAIIITKALIEEREFEDIEEFFKLMKSRFKWFLVNFEFDKKYDLVVLAE